MAGKREMIIEDLRQKLDTFVESSADITLYRVAKDTGLSMQTIYNFHSGKPSSGKTVEAIADYLGCKLTTVKRKNGEFQYDR